jgi:hypothetical protein
LKKGFSPDPSPKTSNYLGFPAFLCEISRKTQGDSVSRKALEENFFLHRSSLHAYSFEIGLLEDARGNVVVKCAAGSFFLR